MIKTIIKYIIILVTVHLSFVTITACKTKKKIQKTAVAPADSLDGKCRLDYKNSKALIKHVKENAFDYTWIYAKANVTAKVDSEENSFDIRVRGKKDSAILITIQAMSLVDIAKILITRDSVKMRIDIKKQYFKGDFNYINDLLHADLDFDMIQAVLFGNSAEFYDEDETKLKPVTDRTNCRYLLSTERKKRLRRIIQGGEIKKSFQTMRLNPDTWKILKNEFIDVATNRIFTANYDDFNAKDSVYAPHHVNIDIKAEKKINVKIDYVRIEKNQVQKLNLNIPSKYDPIPVNKPK
jgi:hypothetical protein